MLKITSTFKHHRVQTSLMLSLMISAGLTACGEEQTVNFGLPQTVESTDYYLQHSMERSLTLGLCITAISELEKPLKNPYLLLALQAQGETKEGAKEKLVQQFKQEFVKFDENCVNAANAQLTFLKEPTKYEGNCNSRLDSLAYVYKNQSEGQKWFLDGSQIQRFFTEHPRKDLPDYDQCEEIKNPKKISQSDQEQQTIINDLKKRAEEYDKLPWQQAVRELVPNEKVHRFFSLDGKTTFDDYLSGKEHISKKNEMDKALYLKYAQTGIAELRKLSFEELANTEKDCATDKRVYSVCWLRNEVLKEKEQQMVQEFVNQPDKLKQTYNEQCAGKLLAFVAEQGVTDFNQVEQEKVNLIKAKESEIFEAHPCSVVEQAFDKLGVRVNHYQKLD
ncbi:hypothetical protein [Lonepinella sp. BR2271]|uniref:hypothetical protein n=1 Tax=Lonepinella sp. BR2271 TaxID=3434550 RepID=UPI003F6DAA45